MRRVCGGPPNGAQCAFSSNHMAALLSQRLCHFHSTNLNDPDCGGPMNVWSQKNWSKVLFCSSFLINHHATDHHFWEEVSGRVWCVWGLCCFLRYMLSDSSEQIRMESLEGKEAGESCQPWSASTTPLLESGNFGAHSTVSHVNRLWTLTSHP